MIVTFSGLIKGLIVLILALATVVAQHWPKNDNGKPMSLAEFRKFAEGISTRSSSPRANFLIGFLFLSTFTIFSILLS